MSTQLSYQGLKQADLMIVKGNPALKITDIQNVEIVFKTASDMTQRN